MLSWLGQKDVNHLIAQGNYPRAIKQLRSQLKKEPKSIHVRKLLADVLVRDGQKRQAIEILEGLVQEYAAEGFVTKAIAVLKKVQRIDPEQSDAEIMLETLVQIKNKSEPASAPIKIDIPAPLPSPPAGAAAASELGARALPPKAEETAEMRTSKLVLSELWFEEAVEERDDFNWSPLFRDFSAEELAALVGGLRLLVKRPGSIIFTEAEPGDSLFVLAHGKARVYRQDDHGHNDQVTVLSEGAVFGIPSVLSGAARTATITAIKECELLELDRQTFDRIAQSYPRVREMVQEIYSSRIAP